MESFVWFLFLLLQFSCFSTMNSLTWVNEYLTWSSWAWRWLYFPDIICKIGVHMNIACVCICVHVYGEGLYLALSSQILYNSQGFRE